MTADFSCGHDQIFKPFQIESGTRVMREKVMETSSSSPSLLGADAGVTYAKATTVNLLDVDGSDEPAVLTTVRGLRRLVTVACETGSRFEREALPDDAAAWMLAPQRIFDGARPVDACQTLEGFRRVTLMHGLLLDIDAGPEHLDAAIHGKGVQNNIGAERQHTVEGTSAEVGLFCATIESFCGSDGRSVQAFIAMVVPDEQAVRRRLRDHYGDELAEAAIVRTGFDANSPLAIALLSEQIRGMLTLVARVPSGALGRGLDIHVEQRLSA